jgi:hypothetical protein
MPENNNEFNTFCTMRAITFTLLLTLLISSCHSQRESLFNGKDLEGWTIFVDDPSVVPEEFFYVRDGVIETTGIPNGYLRTVKSYADFHLHVEWRYPDEPVNSGIFVHTSGPDLLWPAHYQGQLKHGFAGDFIVHGVGEVATIRDTVYTSSKEVKPVIPKEHPSNENPAGEWNSYDIICKGNRVELRVNGLLQNVATGCSLTGGNIGLQAEGSRIQFRNLWIEPIK